MKTFYFSPQIIKHHLNFKRLTSLTLFAVLSILSFHARSQTDEIASLDKLKVLSVEELMNLEVTSVSKGPEKLSEVASAIQVITQQDIKRSAATSLPEALRLASNLQVSQINSRHWIISARGFNNIFSNKLLVMIDGRTVYSPLFAGVFWDSQNVLLEDIDRIEVISGPGGTLWGANAVNGVINIITKSAKHSQGLYVAGSLGTFLNNQFEARYGGTFGPDLSYRVYGQHSNRNHTILPAGQDNTDEWGLFQGGFSLNYDPSDVNAWTIQGNFHGGREQSNATPSSIDGQSLMGTWSHTISDKSNFLVQAYVDRTWRHDVASAIDDELLTYDLDVQHRFQVASRHQILWGAGYRYMDDQTTNRTQFVGFLPGDRKMSLFSSFVQDEITIVPDRFKATVGAKLQHNDFSGFDLQPSARLSWTPYKQHTIWSAISRAVRSPSRIDVDYHIPAYRVPPTSPSVAGGPNFVSEKLIAYELGYRVQPSSVLALSLAAFYNQYDDLYSVEALPGTLTYQIQNGAEGYSQGLELLGNYQPASFWRLRGGYTYFYKKLKNKPGNTTDPSVLLNLGIDAENQFLVQSILDLPGNFQFDLLARSVGSLPATAYNPAVPSYYRLDARLAWEYRKQLEFSVAGQSLLDKRHAESGSQIPRGVYGKITWRY